MHALPLCFLLSVLALMSACGERSALYHLTEPSGLYFSKADTCDGFEPPKSERRLHALLGQLKQGHSEDETGLYVIEDGGGALAARGWLTREATKSIDIQYFIFSADALGLIALQELRVAAERGVKVRLIIDDLLYDGDAQILRSFSELPNVEVKIYNPSINVGLGVIEKASNLANDFRNANQRMHNKTFIVDEEVVITGGRNVADEYFDFNLEFNFRDRDMLLIQGAASDVQASFNQFWEDKRTVAIQKLLPKTHKDSETILTQLARLRCNPKQFWPEVQQRIASAPMLFTHHIQSGRLAWVKGVHFVSDDPGKNDGTKGLKGLGKSTKALLQLVEGAKKSVVIQTPYLVTTSVSQGLFKRAIDRGVTVKIITNSLSSTDNYPAFAGYQKDRDRLVELGVELYESRPDAPAWADLMTSALSKKLKVIDELPSMGLHAKSMVIDGETLMVGTFNLDPRSANLNTECVTIAKDPPLAQKMLEQMELEMQPMNAWRVTRDWNPDGEASFAKRWRAFWGSPVPKSIL